MEKPRVLFVLKYRSDYTGAYPSGSYFSSGLYWSAKFVSDMLDEFGVCSHLVQVTDNNDIDREVAKFKPDVVVIEALWVVPEKFDILKKLHPNVIWIVRLHSNVPFLANEGIAISWIKGYLQRGVYVAVNEERIYNDLWNVFFWSDLFLYLPNYYPVSDNYPHPEGCHFRVGCYGAIRPMKNQLIQAMAAIKYANQEGRTLDFHINAGRVEGGESVLKNLQALFEGSGHNLIEDSWAHHSDFIERLRHMDLVMQVSLSETFSIVSADAVSIGVPLVVSPEVQWASSWSKADPTNMNSIVNAIRRAEDFPKLNVALNRKNLKKYSRKSREIWTSLF